MNDDLQNIRRLASELRQDASDMAEKLDEAQERLVPLQSALSSLGTLELVGEAADGEVRATVTGMGEIKDVYVSPRAQRLSESELSAAVVEAVNEAQKAVAERSKEILEEANGQPIPDADAAARAGGSLSDVREALARLTPIRDEGTAS
ncbi:MAG TPA: YbaB/EbfC family nucleoid-associated protein [Actinopolymorphaceae bacterium]